MRRNQTFPVTQSAIAGAIVFGAAFVAAFGTSWLLGVFDRDVVNGLGALGLFWALTIGAIGGATAAISYNLLSSIGAFGSKESYDNSEKELASLGA